MQPGTRVTILGLNYAPEPTGNAPYTTSLAEYMAHLGSHVRVVTSFPHYPQWRTWPGFEGRHLESEINGVAVSRLSHYVPNPPRGFQRLLSEVSFGLRQAFSRWGQSEAVIFVSPALFSSAICMVRAVAGNRRARVVWVQDLYSQGMDETGEGAGAAARVARMVEGWTLRRAHAVVAIHESMAVRMREDLGILTERIHVIPNWSHIVPSDSERDEARTTLGWDRRAFVALHAGNMGRKQGLENVVEAARLADHTADGIQFVLLGDGAERAVLERLGDGVRSLRFIDPMVPELFPEALAAADVLVVNELPGVRDMAVPSKLTSYFAAGRPVVAAGEPDGIVAEVMRTSGAGRCVPSGDARALLDALVSLRDDDAARATAGEAAREFWRARMSAEPALAAWVRLLDELIDERQYA